MNIRRRTLALDNEGTDNEITYMLNIARKYAEGNKCNIPYSIRKHYKVSTMKYMKVLSRKKIAKE